MKPGTLSPDTAARRKIIADLLAAQHAPITDDPDELLKEIRAWIENQTSLPQSDADWFYKKMQRDKWRVGGVPVNDWRDVAISYNRHRVFPSQLANHIEKRRGRANRAIREKIVDTQKTV